jgi:hypothetical protein
LRAALHAARARPAGARFRRRARALAGGDESPVIPGHDPLMRLRFPAEDPAGEVIRLDLPPIRS